MKRLLLLGALALLTACAVPAKSPKPFNEIFEENTLRVDYSVISGTNPTNLSVMIDSISQWPGWYGKRVNLTSITYPDMLTVSVIDSSTGDTLYVDAKSPDMYSPMDPNAETAPTYTVLVPKPKRPFIIDLTLMGWSPNGGTDKWRSFQEHFSKEKLEHIDCCPEGSKHPYKVLRKATAPGNHLNMCILAEGYTVDEMDRFLEKASKLEQALFDQPAFKEKKESFNLVAVMLPSPESGITVPSQDININSALLSHFDSFQTERLLTVPNNRTVWDAMEGIPAQHILILANTEKYGGSGDYGNYAIASDGLDNFEYILLHEFGHSFGWLGDEYEMGFDTPYPPEMEPQEPNITTLHDFSGKWQNLIDSGEASLIEGAGYHEKGVWRGCEHCLMRDLGDKYFCVVCAQALSKMIDFYIVERSEN